MALIHWSEYRHSTHIVELDIHKRQLVQTVNSLEGAEDGQLRALFTRLLIQAERYFELEHRFMRETGFPGVNDHAGEHQQLLNEVRYIIQRIENGLYSLGHTYIKARLPSWFNAHAETLDLEWREFMADQRQAA